MLRGRIGLGASLSVCLPATIAWLGTPLISEASPVIWGFTGEITYIFDDTGIFSDAVQVGSSFSVEFSFDPTTPDIRPDSTVVGLYHGAVLDLSGVMGEISFSGAGSSNVIRVGDQHLGVGDAWSIEIDNLMVPAVGDLADLTIVLQDSTGQVFSDDSLPMFPPDLDSLDFTLFHLVTEIDAAEAVGEIHTIIPEPCTLWLIMVGTGGLAGLNRRRLVLRTNLGTAKLCLEAR